MRVTVCCTLGVEGVGAAVRSRASVVIVEEVLDEAAEEVEEALIVLDPEPNEFKISLKFRDKEAEDGVGDAEIEAESEVDTFDDCAALALLATDVGVPVGGAAPAPMTGCRILGVVIARFLIRRFKLV